jgi:hypothetical protein
MWNAHPDDVKLLRSFQQGAMISFVLVVLIGGSSLLARFMGHEIVGEILLLLTYLPGLAFAICALLLLFGILVFIVSGAGRGNGS